MKKSKYLLIIALCLAFSFVGAKPALTVSAAATEMSYDLIVNGEWLTTADIPMYKAGNKDLVDAEKLCSYIKDVTWSYNSKVKRYTIKYGSKAYQLTVNSKTALYKKGKKTKKVSMSTKVQKINGAVCIPVSIVQKVMNYKAFSVTNCKECANSWISTNSNGIRCFDTKAKYASIKDVDAALAKLNYDNIYGIKITKADKLNTDATPDRIFYKGSDLYQLNNLLAPKMKMNVEEYSPKTVAGLEILSTSIGKNGDTENVPPRLSCSTDWKNFNIAFNIGVVDNKVTFWRHGTFLSKGMTSEKDYCAALLRACVDKYFPEDKIDEIYYHMYYSLSRGKGYDEITFQGNMDFNVAGYDVKTVTKTADGSMYGIFTFQ